MEPMSHSEGERLNIFLVIVNIQQSLHFGVYLVEVWGWMTCKTVCDIINVPTKLFVMKRRLHI